MKTYFKYIALTLLLALGLVSCEDNENWRIIPYEPEPEAPIDGPEQLYVVGAHQNWAPDAAVIGKLYPIDAMGNYAGYAYLNGEYKCTSQQIGVALIMEQVRLKEHCRQLRMLVT